MHSSSSSSSSSSISSSSVESRSESSPTSVVYSLASKNSDTSYDELKDKGVSEIADFCKMDNRADYAGKIQTDENEITMDILLSDIKRNLIFSDTEEEVKDLLIVSIWIQNICRKLPCNKYYLNFGL